jgi:serine/threonine protein kinase/Tfp pilus assembly protein PilF
MNRQADADPTDPGELLASDMAEAWARGERLPAEHYLACHADLLPAEGAVRLIYEETCLRLERGEEVTAEELARRFPCWANELSAMLDCHRLIQASLAPPQFPAPGELLGDFRLIRELGRGTSSRVFLACQPTLADRPVVLKVTPRQGHEHLTLARLQQTHIVPLHAVHDFPARNLRALCQPYLGGATLAQLLDLLRDVPARRRTGQSLIDALDRAAGAPAPGTSGPRAALARADYVAAVCWIGACLAGALHHAHRRGLVHLDIKPGNVLLAADGQPLLLDFHLALHPVAAGALAPEGLGGTLDCMSPEQRAAYAAARRGAPVPVPVDGRSDTYSLGRLLYLALGGEALLPLRRCNPRVSVGLADVVARCLAPDPKDRYPDAASLADDLRRHLAHQPLRGVPNRSLGERWRKWRQRRPHALVRAGAIVALLAAAAATAAAALDRLHDAREGLREGQFHTRQGAHAEAARALAWARGRVNGLPGCGSLVAQIDADLLAARQGAAAAKLHAVTERLRLLAGGDTQSAGDLRALEAHCRTAWEQVRHVAGQQARSDVIDLALLWTDLKQRLGPTDPSSRAELLAVLAEAEELCGPDAALAHARQALGGLTGPLPAARTFHEHAALGRSLLRTGDLARAAEELDRAVALRPQDFWSHFYRGTCAHRRGRPRDAVDAFSVAVALAPDLAMVYHNRALALAACGDSAAALRDCDRALALAPDLAAAALNRGVLRYQQGLHAQALADLQHALRHGADPAAAHYNLALVHAALGDRTRARQDAESALRHDPSHAQARRLGKLLRSEE